MLRVQLRPTVSQLRFTQYLLPSGWQLCLNSHTRKEKKSKLSKLSLIPYFCISKLFHHYFWLNLPHWGIILLASSKICIKLPSNRNWKEAALYKKINLYLFYLFLLQICLRVKSQNILWWWHPVWKLNRCCQGSFCTQWQFEVLYKTAWGNTECNSNRLIK